MKAGRIYKDGLERGGGEVDWEEVSEKGRPKGIFTKNEGQ
jgi:hypothetical protein